MAPCLILSGSVLFPVLDGHLAAGEELAAEGILTGVMMMPILPFIEDTEENITAIVERTHASGGSYIIPWFGMSLRDRQRAYYYDQLDRLSHCVVLEFSSEEQFWLHQKLKDCERRGRGSSPFHAQRVKCTRMGISTAVMYQMRVN